MSFAVIMGMMISLHCFAQTATARQGEATTRQPPPVGTWRHSYNATLNEDQLTVTVLPPIVPYHPDIIQVEQAGQQVWRVTMPEEMGEIRLIKRASQDRIVLVQQSPAPYAQVNILNLATRAFEAHFPCYDPQVSPNGRFVAYKKFYPAHFADDSEVYSDSELIYDATLPKQSSLDPRRILKGSYSVDQGTEGILVYPRHWTLDPIPGDLSGAHIEHNFSTVFVWSADSTKLFFMDDQFPADQAFAARQKRGNMLPTATLPMHSETKFVLINFFDNQPNTRVLAKDVCALPSGNGCEVAMTGAVFGRDGISITISPSWSTRVPVSSTTLLYKDFRPL